MKVRVRRTGTYPIYRVCWASVTPELQGAPRVCSFGYWHVFVYERGWDTLLPPSLVYHTPVRGECRHARECRTVPLRRRGRRGPLILRLSGIHFQVVGWGSDPLASTVCGPRADWDQQYRGLLRPRRPPWHRRHLRRGQCPARGDPDTVSARVPVATPVRRSMTATRKWVFQAKRYATASSKAIHVASCKLPGSSLRERGLRLRGRVRLQRGRGRG